MVRRFLIVATTLAAVAFSFAACSTVGHGLCKLNGSIHHTNDCD